MSRNITRIHLESYFAVAGSDFKNGLQIDFGNR